MPMMDVTCLWQLPVQQTISANGNSGEINVAAWSNFIIMASCGVPTGTSPTLAFHVDGYDAFGTAYQDLCSNEAVLNFSGGGAQALQSTFGINAAFVATTSPGVPGNYNLLTCAPEFIAVRWVIGGTGSPTFPTTGISLYGR